MTEGPDKRLEYSPREVFTSFYYIRLDFIQDYTLKSLRLKQEKWNKLVVSDEQRGYILSFIEKDLPQELIISQNIGGQLQVHTDWPSPLRNKGVFFVKRHDKPLPEQVEDLLDYMACGDIHPNTLGSSNIKIKITNQLPPPDHFCALVEEVFVPIFRNELNMAKFPQCVSDGEILMFCQERADAKIILFRH